MPRTKSPSKRQRPQKLKATPEFAFIYLLLDPRTKRVGYVGVSVNPFGRYMGHICRSPGFLLRSRHPKDQWIHSLLSKGTPPVLKIVARVHFDRRMAFEKSWMAKLIREKKVVRGFQNQCFPCAGWKLSEIAIKCWGSKRSKLGERIKNNRI